LGTYYKIGGKFMGKRELLIIAGFLVIGAGAYQLSAPPETGERGFSFSRLMDAMRREVRGFPGTATHESTGTIPVSADLTELRVRSPARGVEVIGEDRADIAYSLSVSSNGATDEEAMTYARAVAVTQDDLGFALRVSLSSPEEARQSAGLVLRVPAGLAVNVEGRANQVQIRGVAAVILDGTAGETRVEDVPGLVSGTHRGGRLTVERAGSVELSVTSARSEFADVRGSLALTARNGACDVRGGGGELTIDQVNVEVRIEAPERTVRVTGTGGEVLVVDPRDEVRVETERAEVEVQLEHAVPMTVITTNDTIRIVLAETASAAVDAIASDGGEVQATEFDLVAETADRESRLAHTFGAEPAPRVTLRNVRGDIVIRRRR
jgi:hypothetical protein